MIRAQARAPSSHSTRLLISVCASLMVVAACGGDGGTGPSPGTPIPEQTYLAKQTNPTNNCGAENLEAFQLVALVKRSGDAYAITGLFEDPVHAELTGDHLTTSVPAPVDTFVVTFGTDWVFAANRETFTGITTLKVSLHDQALCTFSFASAGTHVAESDRTAAGEPPTTAGSGAPAAAMSGPHAISAIPVTRSQFATLTRAAGPAGPGSITMAYPIVCSPGKVETGGVTATAVSGLFNGLGAPWQVVFGDTWLYRWNGSVFAFTGLGVRSNAVAVAAPSADAFFFPRVSDPGANAELVGATFSNLPEGYYTVISRYYWYPPDWVSNILIGQVDLEYNEQRDYIADEAPGVGWCHVL